MATFKQRGDRRGAGPPPDLGLGGELVDLPLGDGASAAGPPGADPLAGAAPGGPAAGKRPPPPGIRRRALPIRPPSGSRRRLLLMLLALPAAAAAGFFLHRSPPVAVLSASLLDFGEVRLGTMGEGLAVEVWNRGQAALAIGSAALGGEAAADFAFAADGCSGRELERDAGCRVELTFAPVSRGGRRGRLELSSNAVNGSLSLPLLGVGIVPELRFEPPRLDFGSLKVGAASAPVALFLTNSGTVPLAMGRIGLGGLAAADFVRLADGCSGRTLEPGDRCSLEYRFVPTTEGVRRAAVEVPSDAPAAQGSPWLVGIGLPRKPLLRLDPDRLELGRWPLGEASPPAAVRLLNEGDGPLDVERIAATVAELAPLEGDLQGVPSGRSAAEAGFELQADGCTGRSIAAGGECRIEIVFRPREEGEARAFFEIRHSAQQGLASLPVFAAGTAPHAFVEPLRLSFGETAVGALSPGRTLRLANAGSAPLRLQELGIEGADRGSFEPVARDCGAVALEPGQGCSIEVRFRPRRDGPHRAELVIHHNAGRGVHRLALNGLGVSARLEVEPARLDLGTVELDAASDGRVTLKNSGRSGLEIRGLRLAGSYAAAFALADDRCSGRVLGPGETCDLAVRFAPGRLGTHNAALKIDHGGAGPGEVAVTATATEPTVPRIAVSPAELDFDVRRVGERSPILSVRAANPGTGRLVLRELRLAGPHADDFRIVPGSCDGAEFVAPGADCTVGVRFTPAAQGPRRAELVVYHNAGDGITRVALSGSGSVPPPVP